MTNVNFTARHISTPQILKRTPFFKYKDADASIVELNCHDSKDIKALCQASNKWQKRHAKYSDLLCIGAIGESELKSSDNHFYALTTQTSDFANLKPKDILGLMMFNAGGSKKNEIELLEVKPTTSFTHSIFRKYKDVGKRLVENVQNIFSDRDMVLYSDIDAVGFYKKMGFENYTKNRLELLWRSPKCAQ